VIDKYQEFNVTYSTPEQCFCTRGEDFLI